MRISLANLAQTAKKMSKPVLYGYPRSSCTWRVRAALAHKGVDFENRICDPYNWSEEEKNAYLKINPLGQVPTLVIDGHTLTQSIAILEYIEETRPKNPLLPKDPIKRAKVRQIVEIINSGTQPLQNPVVAKRASNDEKKQTEWQVYWIEKGMAVVEKILAESSGKCCVGDSLTFADLCLVPQMLSVRRFGADASKFPLCVRISEELLLHESFRKTHPNNVVDTEPGDDRRGPI